jgi:hypothetical protein
VQRRALARRFDLPNGRREQLVMGGSGGANGSSGCACFATGGPVRDPALRPLPRP